MSRSAKDGVRSSLHYGGEGVLVHPSHQGVCGWHVQVPPNKEVIYLKGCLLLIMDY